MYSLYTHMTHMCMHTHTPLRGHVPVHAHSAVCVHQLYTVYRVLHRCIPVYTPHIPSYGPLWGPIQSICGAHSAAQRVHLTTHHVIPRCVRTCDTYIPPSGGYNTPLEYLPRRVPYAHNTSPRAYYLLLHPDAAQGGLRALERCVHLHVPVHTVCVSGLLAIPCH